MKRTLFKIYAFDCNKNLLYLHVYNNFNNRIQIVFYVFCNIHNNIYRD